jgi:hypothetical protein
MKKKGVEYSTSQIVGWAIGIIVVIVVIWSFWCPQCVAVTGRDILFYIGFGALPGTKPPTFRGEPVISPELKTYFYDLASRIKSSKEDTCLISIGDAPSHKDLRIILSSGAIEIRKKADIGGTTWYEKELIDAKPCRIIDEAALNFHRCCIKSNTCNSYSCSGSLFHEEEFIKIEKNNDFNYLLKTGQYICIIEFYGDRWFFGDWGEGCPEVLRDEGGDGIDDDCREDIESKVPKCD